MRAGFSALDHELLPFARFVLISTEPVCSDFRVGHCGHGGEVQNNDLARKSTPTHLLSAEL